jgi:UDP-glucose 4-epimerase
MILSDKKILLTGGAGYIGSHTCIELLNIGYELVVYDNLSNSSQEALRRVEKISNKSITFIEGDIRDEDTLTSALSGCDAVIHFAGLKAVGESVEKPLEYYDNNVQGTLCLLRAMIKNDIKSIVFSSSATVYGDPQYLPLDEKHPLSTTNPYGATKLMIEDILRDLYKSDDSWKISILRYFNPVGSHSSGLIGEDPNGIPNNLMPFISQVAIGKLKSLNVFGDDWDTVDGTGVRDYIHVVDLALGHIKALESLDKPQCEAINLGTGNGYSVLEVVKAYEKASNTNISYVIQDRRDGDIASCYANATKAKELLGWEAKYDINKMCEDSWNWQMKNPDGYNN